MSPDEQLELLRRFAPTLHFDALERWRPGPVERYLEHSAVLDGGDRQLPGTPPAEAAMRKHGDDPKARLDPLEHGADVDTQKRSNEMLAVYGQDPSLDAAGVAYGRVVRSRDAFFLQYWLFYADNPCVLPPGRHDGDWELVQIWVERSGAEFRPTHLTLAEHGKPVSEPIVATDADIDVFVAVDSHACYFEEGANPIIPLSDVCEPAGTPSATPEVVLLPIETSKEDWAQWAGRWGLDRGPGTWLALLLRFKRTPFFLRWLNKVGAGESPPGPAHQGQSWRSPRAFAARGTGRRATTTLLQRLAHFLGHTTWPKQPPEVRVTSAEREPGDPPTCTIEAEAAGRFLRRVTLVSVAFWEERADGTRRALAMHSAPPGRHEVTLDVSPGGELLWRAAGYNRLRQRGEPVGEQPQ